ncbi:MAG: accessory factor UbiK family protein [bacterium]
MTPDQLLKQFSAQFNAVFSPGAESLSSDIQKQLKAAAQAAFERMDVVTRDEFEAQKAVLMRSREKLDALEQQIQALEQSLTTNHSKPGGTAPTE